MKHLFTPGPWNSQNEPKAVVFGYPAIGITSEEVGGVIAEVYIDKEIGKANARLIAAAPELHAAVLGLLNAYQGPANEMKPAIDAAIVALNKVRYGI